MQKGRAGQGATGIGSEHMDSPGRIPAWVTDEPTVYSADTRGRGGIGLLLAQNVTVAIVQI